MAFEYSQDSYWNGATFYQQHLDTVPLAAGDYFDSAANPLMVNPTEQVQYNGD